MLLRVAACGRVWLRVAVRGCVRGGAAANGCVAAQINGIWSRSVSSTVAVEAIGCRSDN